MADNENLLTKVNLNGTELVIADMDARQQIKQGGESMLNTIESLNVLTNRVTNVENESLSLITATYDAQSSTLSLTSKS